VTRQTLLVVAMMLASPCLARGQDVPPPPDDLGELSLEQLMDTEIVSASRVAEPLSEAPATVIVVTREEILQRGYTDVSEVLADLPGMDMVRPWGDTYLKNYWRGYRNAIGDPFLIMVDGLVFNHLYFNTADVLVTLPLSSVERIEVVYGPASSVYGANAFMGVVNVITRAAGGGADGTSHLGWVAAGSDGARLADWSSRWQSGTVRATAAARFDDGELDDAHADAYALTRPELYADRQLWGGFVDNPNIAGSFRSRRRFRALQARLELGSLELGFDHLVMRSGYGVAYTGDRAQNDAIWSRPETSGHLRARVALGPRVTSTTLLRARRSSVTNDSFFLEGFEVPAADGGTERVVDYSYWQSLNSSWSAFQDFEIDAGERVWLAAGLKYEQKDLQKAYDNPYGPTVPVEGLDVGDYAFPEPPSASTMAQNRITTEDRGAYVQARLSGGEGRALHMGLRHDDNSQYGGSTTVRAGLVLRRGKWGAKALYGEAFQEPTPRLLYGGWTGSGSDPDLRPETSRTMELSGSWSGQDHHVLVSGYHVRNRETIVNTAAGAQNLGDRAVYGLDVHAQARRRLGRTHLRAWGYWSNILQADEDTPDGGEVAIGDLARHQLHLGLAAETGSFSGALRARFVGSRDTVSTNPIREVPSWGTVDLTLSHGDTFVPGLDVVLKLTNALDATVLHPGVREAQAGEGPGRFLDDGSWVGSAGYFSSLLPQPGRAALLMLRLRLPAVR
jgi:outer membrane receptor for ferrienterochelin and colicins